MKKSTPRTKLRNYGEVKKTMKEFERGELHSGSEKGPKVKSREQALAIGYSKERKKEGAK